MSKPKRNPALPESKQKSNQEGMKLLRKKSHEILDQSWMALFGSEKQKQKFRSLLYKLWAAILWNTDHGFTIDGIKDPFEGLNHISKLPEAYHEVLHRFIHHILHEKSAGNVNKLTPVSFKPISLNSSCIQSN